MRIDFNLIEIHSFMSFEDQSFDFSKMHGMTLVQGKNNDVPNLKNGSGKSTLFMSLLYALFGQLQNKIKNENIVNRYASDKDTRVVLSFNVDGESYKIARGISKGKTSYLNLYSIENGEEKDITKSSISETQEYIEQQLIHCDISIFMRTILLSADQTYNFYTLKKADKKEFVEKLFDISLFEDMFQAIHKDKLQLDKELLAQQNQLLVLNKNVEDYEQLEKNFIDTNNQKMSSTEKQMSVLQKSLDALNAKSVNVDEQAVKKIEDAKAKIQSAMSQTTQKWQNAVSQETKLKVAKSKISTEIKLKDELMKKHADLENKLCSKCQDIFREHYNLNEAKTSMSSLEEKLSKVNSAILATSKSKEEQQSLLEKMQQKMQLANSKTMQLLSEKNKHDSEVSQLRSQIAAQNNVLSTLKESTNPYSSMLMNAKSNVESTSSLIEQNSSKHRYLEFAEGIVSQDTLRKFIIKDLIVLLNNKIKSYLMRLGAKYYVEFDEDMDYDFIVPNGTCEFGNFSAGERMRLMIATSLAFRDFMSIRNGLNSNVLILDEYFDSAIDSICIESMLKILEEYKNKMDQNIFVISHRLEVNLDQFDRTIVVEKTNNISKVLC